MTTKEPPVIHIHAQEAWHDEAYLVGNRKALEKLKELIEQALKNENTANSVFYVADGEGFDLHVVLDDNDWQSESWQKAELPYRDELASAPDKKEKTLHPVDRIKKKQ